jgi:hypothetical protein
MRDGAVDELADWTTGHVDPDRYDVNAQWLEPVGALDDASRS